MLIFIKKMEEEDKISWKNSTVSFNRRLSEAKKLKNIKYAEERRFHTASNYYGV